MTKPLYFYNGTTFEQVGPTTPQSPIAYQTSAPTGPATGDLWIDSDGDVDTYNRQLTRYYFVATAGQTTITGVDANSLTLAYVAGSEAVYVNGALQVRGQDYTATNGTSVVMSTGLAVNDVVEIFAYTAFTVANAYTKSETDGLVSTASGLQLIVPGSVAVGSGTGSANTAGYVSFSGSSSVSLNNVFSSTYDNYRIVVNVDSTSASNEIWLRLRLSGTDTNTNYYRSGWYVTNANTSGTWYVGNPGSEVILVDGGTDTKTASVDVYYPNKNTETNFSGFSRAPAQSNTFGCHQYSTTQFTGFSLITSTGTMAGNVAVYGYKD